MKESESVRLTDFDIHILGELIFVQTQLVLFLLALFLLAAGLLILRGLRNRARNGTLHAKVSLILALASIRGAKLAFVLGLSSGVRSIVVALTSISYKFKFKFNGKLSNHLLLWEASPSIMGPLRSWSLSG
jgi:hypothetical protein